VTESGTPRARRADLLIETWNGLTERLEALYGARSRVAGDRDIQVVPVSNLENLAKRQQDQSRPLDLPVIGISLGAIEPNVTSFNASVMRKYGQRTQISADRSTWTILSVVPITATFQIRLATDDLPTMIRMVDRWMSNEIWGLKLEQSDLKVSIQVLADKALTIPQAAPNAGGGEEFHLDTVLRVATYSGYVYQVPSIFFTELDLVVTDTPGNINTLAALPADQMEAFTITRDFHGSDKHRPEA
jgi:hypothetical protein